ncbi:hypothetical protein [Pseudoalteromonas sp. A757]|uniref:hypothetical protein n=1 Tax=Pseudoalteromonas sp. A757 TaxID=2250709 RepID=UPI000FFE53AB|nr:hypothetical protein [Pseudoalteromonas sp. A757]RXE88660.1 hypothetical protein DRB05_02670 [Pseudoalteromonas sp. A757]
MEKKEASIPDWVKDIDIGRATENLLMGVILFVGRLVITSWDFLFRPQRVRDEVLSIKELKDSYKLTHVRPLVFFVIIGFISIAFSYKSLNQLIFISWLFERYDFLSSGINTEASKFSITKAAGAMIPTVLIISLYAFVTQKVFSKLNLTPQFKLHLAICCYTSGMLLLMLMFTNMYEMHIWADPNNDSTINDTIRPAIGTIGMVGSALLSLFVIYRYFYYLYVISASSLAKTIMATLLSAMVFWCLFFVIGLFMDPVLKSIN